MRIQASLSTLEPCSSSQGFHNDRTVLKEKLRSFVPTASSLLTGFVQTRPICSMETQTEIQAHTDDSRSHPEHPTSRKALPKGPSPSRGYGISTRSEDIFIHEDENGFRSHYCPLREDLDGCKEDSPDSPMRVDGLPTIIESQGLRRPDVDWTSDGSGSDSDKEMPLMAEEPSSSASSEEPDHDESATDHHCFKDASLTDMIYTAVQYFPFDLVENDQDVQFLVRQGKQMPCILGQLLEEETLEAWAQDSSDEFSYDGHDEKDILKKPLTDDSDMEEFNEIPCSENDAKTSELFKDLVDFEELKRNSPRKSPNSRIEQKCSSNPLVRHFGDKDVVVENDESGTGNKLKILKTDKIDNPSSSKVIEHGSTSETEKINESGLENNKETIRSGQESSGIKETDIKEINDIQTRDEQGTLHVQDSDSIGQREDGREQTSDAIKAYGSELKNKKETESESVESYTSRSTESFESVVEKTKLNATTLLNCSKDTQELVSNPFSNTEMEETFVVVSSKLNHGPGDNNGCENLNASLIGKMCEENTLNDWSQIEAKTEEDEKYSVTKAETGAVQKTKKQDSLSVEPVETNQTKEEESEPDMAIALCFMTEAFNTKDEKYVDTLSTSDEPKDKTTWEGKWSSNDFQNILLDEAAQNFIKMTLPKKSSSAPAEEKGKEARPRNKLTKFLKSVKNKLMKNK